MENIFLSLRHRAKFMILLLDEILPVKIYFTGMIKNKLSEQNKMWFAFIQACGWILASLPAYIGMWFYVQEHPKAQLAVVLVLKCLRRRGLKVSSNSWESQGSNYIFFFKIWYLYTGTLKELNCTGDDLDLFILLQKKVNKVADQTAPDLELICLHMLFLSWLIW